MPHDPNTGPHGLTTAVVNRAAHKAGRPIAARILAHPWARKMIDQYPDEARLVSEALAGAAEFFELPGKGPLASFVNRTTEVIGSELAELIGEYLKNPHDPALAEKFAVAVDAKVEDELNRKVRFVGSGVSYVPAGCSHYRRQKWEKEEHDVPRREAIRQGARPGCAWCYAGLFREETLPDPNAPEAASQPPADPAAPARTGGLMDRITDRLRGEAKEASETAEVIGGALRKAADALDRSNERRKSEILSRLKDLRDRITRELNATNVIRFSKRSALKRDLRAVEDRLAEVELKFFQPAPETIEPETAERSDDHV